MWFLLPGVAQLTRHMYVASYRFRHHHVNFNPLHPPQDLRAIRENAFTPRNRYISPTLVTHQCSGYLSPRVLCNRGLHISAAEGILAFAVYVSKCRAGSILPSNYFTQFSPWTGRRDYTDPSRHETTMERGTWAVRLPLSTPTSQPWLWISRIASFHDSLGRGK
jgi:hypothetical protein